MGVIGLHEYFSHGHLTIPGHPNCRCAVVPVIAEDMPSEKFAKAFDPKQPRDKDGRWTAGLSSLAEKSVSGVEFAKVSAGSFDADRVAAEAGFALHGYTAIADTHAIQHTLKKHGGKKEVLRGQKQIDKTDFELLPEILISADKITADGKNKIGRDVIGFDKKIGGWRYRAVMEIRAGRMELALNSLYTTGKDLGDG